MELTLKEIFKMNMVQTDPNFSNYMIDKSSRKLILLDFGSTLKYSKGFCKNFYLTLDASWKKDFKTAKEFSVKLGLLTGLEN